MHGWSFMYQVEVSLERVGKLKDLLAEKIPESEEETEIQEVAIALKF